MPTIPVWPFGKYFPVRGTASDQKSNPRTWMGPGIVICGGLHRHQKNTPSEACTE